MNPLRVLVLFERSGIVREAFNNLGHEAWSVDIEPAEDGSLFHIQEDAFVVAEREAYRTDLAIAHPECTDLSVSGAHRFKEKIADGRQQRAIEAFMRVTKLPIPKLCIENPVSIMSTRWRKPDQIIQPYQFGHDASKQTCVWLKNLRPLRLDKSKYVKPRWVCQKCGAAWRETELRPLHHGIPCFSCHKSKLLPRWANQTDSGQNRLGPSEKRAMDRARTYEGIARAMAEQYGGSLFGVRPQ